MLAPGPFRAGEHRYWARLGVRKGNARAHVVAGEVGEYLAGALLEVLESLNRKTPVRGAGEREDRFACVHCSDE